MKKLTLYVLTLSLAITSSCKKDEEGSQQSPGSFAMNDINLDVDKAYLELLGVDSSSSDYGSRIIVTLLTSGMEADINSYGNLDISGNGYKIMFELISSKKAELSEGIYTLNRIDKPSFTYNFAMAEPDGNFTSKGEVVTVDGAAGQLIVSGAGSEYELSGTFAGPGLSTFTPHSFTISYSGNFQVIDNR